MDKITKKQQQIGEFIESFIAANGYSLLIRRSLITLR